LPEAVLHNTSAKPELVALDDADRYLLRGLLWCGLCDESFACCLLPTGIRSYGCTHIGCPRPLVAAEEAEQLVWRAFALRHEAEAVATKRSQRQAALYEALVRVIVHGGVADLDFDWRD
jgi:hypothetical protein